jgi:hypothetical protein
LNDRKGSSRLRAALVAGVAVGAVMLAFPWLVLFGLVPLIPRPKAEFSVADLGSIEVAGATLLLAVFTAVLAWFTRQSISETRTEAAIADAALQAARDQAAASAQQAAMAERSFEAAWKPLLVDVPWGLSKRTEEFADVDDAEIWLANADADLDDPNEDLQITVALRNIGGGPAFINTAKMRAADSAFDCMSISSLLVAPNEVTRFTFVISKTKATDGFFAKHLMGGEPFDVVVTYTDLASRQWRSEAQVSRPSVMGGRLIVRVALFDGDQTKPFAMTGKSVV